MEQKRQFLVVLISGAPLSVAATQLGISLTQATKLELALSKRVPISLAEFDAKHANNAT